MKYTFTGAEFNQNFISGMVNGKAFIADYYGVQGYTSELVNASDDSTEYETYIDEEISDPEFWGSLISYMYDTLGDEYGKLIWYIESGN